MLKVDHLHVYYGNIHALKGICLSIEEGSIVTLIGANGAGKSTTLNTIAGLLRAREGTIFLREQKISDFPDYRIVEAGVSLVPEGREVFPALSVDDNLTLGAYTVRDKQKTEAARERAYDLFPRLRDRRAQLAGTLSGGEQQMLAIARALMTDPQLLMLDEPSLGLAPNLVREIFDMIREINRSGKTILLIEQNANMALSIADYAYVLETGRITIEGPAADLKKDDRIRRAYLGQAN